MSLVMRDYVVITSSGSSSNRPIGIADRAMMATLPAAKVCTGRYDNLSEVSSRARHPISGDVQPPPVQPHLFYPFTLTQTHPTPTSSASLFASADVRFAGRSPRNQFDLMTGITDCSLTTALSHCSCRLSTAELQVIQRGSAGFFRSGGFGLKFRTLAV